MERTDFRQIFERTVQTQQAESVQSADVINVLLVVEKEWRKRQRVTFFIRTSSCS